MPNTHTPGPWHFTTGHTSFSVRSASGSICQLSWHSLTKNPSITVEERRANARLIAAAPELLEALEKATTLLTKAVGDIVAYRLMAGKRLSRSVTAEYVEGINAFDTLVAAITKATGHG